jgi:hypothetical protein
MFVFYTDSPPTPDGASPFFILLFVITQLIRICAMLFDAAGADWIRFKLLKKSCFYQAFLSRIIACRTVEIIFRLSNPFRFLIVVNQS